MVLAEHGQQNHYEDNQSFQKRYLNRAERVQI